MVFFFFLIGPIAYEFFYNGILDGRVNSWECMIFFLPLLFFFKKQLQKLTKRNSFMFTLIEFIYKINLFLIIWCYLIFGLSLPNIYYKVDLLEFYNDKIHHVFFVFLHAPVNIIISFYGTYYSKLAFFVNNFTILVLQWFIGFVNKDVFLYLFMIVLNLVFIVLGCIKILFFWLGKAGVFVIKCIEFYAIFMDLLTTFITKTLVFLGLKESWEELFNDNNESDGGDDNIGGGDI